MKCAQCISSRFSFLLLLVGLAVPSARAVTIDMVTVGNPGNAADPATGSQYGSVSYAYRIGKYDVTIQQYTDFLNAVAKSDPYSLYNASMASNPNIAGISRAGVSGSYSYSVLNNDGDSGGRPITYVSWFDAARFANWMHNGQGSGSTETGAYTLGGATSGNAVERNPGATFFIPTEDEWYKAAYFSQSLNSGSGGYYAYATQSNSDPGNVVGGGANQANYYKGGVFTVTQSSTYDVNQNYITAVGVFVNSASYYGTFDQSGNVYQWNDLDGTVGASRGLRGGYWYALAPLLSSSGRESVSLTEEGSFVGFRLAAPVPEIDTVGLRSALALVIGGFGLLERRRLKTV